MSKRTTFRFMVDAGSRRSAVWAVSINRSDVYISSSISKQDKVSLHESGSYQWSMRSEALPHASYVPETGRHLARWKNPQIPAGDFTQNFFVLIAESELRLDHKVPEKKVMLLPPPAVGFAAQVGFFFLPNREAGNLLGIEPQPLFLHQLQDKRILMLVHQTIKIDPSTTRSLQAVHWAALQEAQRNGVERPQAIVRITNAAGLSGVMEVAPREPLMVFASPGMDAPVHKWVSNGVKHPRT